jgi:hypothetical protein
MKISVKENECFFKITIEPEGRLTFRYAFNLKNPSEMIEEGHELNDSLLSAVALIAGIVHMTKHHPEDLMEIGDSAIDDGTFTFNDTVASEMIDFINTLTDEEMDLLEAPVKGEA